MSNAEFQEKASKYLMQTYPSADIGFVSGQGINLTDCDGNQYMDFLSGLSVCCLGHSHPVVMEAITEQAAKIIHTSNLYIIPNQVKLARYLQDITFASRSFFCNSGAESIEAAIKLSRRYHSKVKGEARPTVLTFEDSFHGRTLAALAATGQPKYWDGFDPLPSGFKQVPFNNIGAVEAALNDDPSIGAVLIELIQAEGGVIVADKDFVVALRELTTQKGVLLIIDEVQTGMGRTGHNFAYEHYGIQPDVMTLSKGLGSGVPIGALLATEEVSKGFEPGSHASTFGGNHLVTAVAIAVIKVFLNDQIVERSRMRGEYIMDRLLKERRSCMKEIRGKGLLIGIELDQPAGPYVSEMRKKGYLVGTAGPNVLRVAPPLIVSQDQCAKMVDTLLEILP